MAYGFTHFEQICLFVVISSILPAAHGVGAGWEMKTYIRASLGLPGATSEQMYLARGYYRSLVQVLVTEIKGY